MLSHVPDPAQWFLLYVVNMGYYVKYEWTEDLPGWMSPFVIKLPVLILRRASEFFWSALSFGMAKAAIC